MFLLKLIQLDVYLRPASVAQRSTSVLEDFAEAERVGLDEPTAFLAVDSFNEPFFFFLEVNDSVIVL